MEAVSSRYSAGATCLINGHATYSFTLDVRNRSRVEWFNSAKPDERWSFTDAAGHFHAYDQTKDVNDRYPTLRRRVEEIPLLLR